MTPIEITPGSTAPAPADPNALAASLAQAAPGAGALDELVYERLTPRGCLDAVRAWEAQVRHAHAGLIRAVGSLTRAVGERDLAETELTVALAWAPATAQGRLAEADALTGLLPETLQQLSAARISVEQARCLAELTATLDHDTARAVQAHLLPRMPGQSNSVTRQAIRRAIVRADPAAAAKRHERQRERRRVELIPEEDGMATVNFYLPADIAQMAMRTLTTMAQSAKRENPGDKRSLDQRRADMLPIALTQGTGTTPGASPAIPAQITVVVGIETLLGLSHEPGHLDGYGAICPEQTRRIAHAHRAQWRFLLTSTDGTAIAASRRRSPRAAMKHLVELMYHKCIFPNCAMRAERCDIDHGVSWSEGGLTSVCNLGPVCRRHHGHKSRDEWLLDRDGDTITWTSALTGQQSTTGPTRYQPCPVAP